MGRCNLWLACTAVLFLNATAVLADSTYHEITATLDTQGHSLSVLDRVHLGDEVQAVNGGYRFALHEGLSPRVETRGWKLERYDGPINAAFFGLNATSATSAHPVPLEGWVLSPPSEGGRGPVEIQYSGEIHHPLGSGKEIQRGFSETPGIIDPRGVFLAGASYWLPTFGDGLLTFTLDAAFRDLDAGWDYVSQGKRAATALAGGGQLVRYECRKPVDEVYLVAGPWTLYQDKVDSTEILAFLRTPDEALATRYLDATKRYIRMYEQMLTPYPWPSFALVENFWDTGYGMPGFTLLGPRIIRFPFILTSSYPHEILHNWWGNSAYLDANEGNWAEGLTAYMADHLFAEHRGEGHLHRRTTLQKFANFVDAEKDFPLVEFRSRHSSATEAVGYGKSLMFFHMLRRWVGEEAFLASLARFHRDNLYARASFADIAKAFEEETGEEWQETFRQWTERTGAPTLAIGDFRLLHPEEPEDSWILQVQLRQTQRERPFRFRVPVAVTLEGKDEAEWRWVTASGRKTTIQLNFDARPLRIDIDPRFDVMRRVDPLEVPPAISVLMGDEDPLFVLPSASTTEEREAWTQLATQWRGGKAVRTAMDSELEGLPEGNLWILGWDNDYAGHAWKPHSEALTSIDPGDGGRFLDRNGSRVIVTRQESDPGTAMGWVAADTAAAIPGLARKLPHYTRYSYLAFKGTEPTNTAKGMWETTDSPLSRQLSPGESLASLQLPDDRPLAEPPPRYQASAFRETVEELTREELEGRGLASSGIAWATRWISDALAKTGLAPAGDLEGFAQRWTWRGGEPERDLVLANLLATKEGTDPSLGKEPVLLMAHLDHLGRGWPDVRSGNEGKIHPGADDNASGVAILLELARTFGEGAAYKRPILIALTTAEEAGAVGSRHLLEQLANRGVRPSACINLDTVGRLEDGPALVLNADSAREWRFLWMGVQYTTGVPFQFVPEPLDSSDQVACLERGIPAVQLFTGAHEDYHRPSDTADKVDYDGLARLAESVFEAVAYLADRVEPLTGSGSPASPAASGPGGVRRVSLGTVPDFTYAGPGVRVEDVLHQSAAQAAGIEAGDILISLGGQVVENLRSYSNILKARQPGDIVELLIKRNGREIRLEATLQAR